MGPVALFSDARPSTHALSLRFRCPHKAANIAVKQPAARRGLQPAPRQARTGVWRGRATRCRAAFSPFPFSESDYYRASLQLVQVADGVSRHPRIGVQSLSGAGSEDPVGSGQGMGATGRLVPSPPGCWPPPSTPQHHGPIFPPKHHGARPPTPTDARLRQPELRPPAAHARWPTRHRGH